MKRLVAIVSLLAVFSCEGTFLNPRKCYTCTVKTQIIIYASNYVSPFIETKKDICGKADYEKYHGKTIATTTKQSGQEVFTRESYTCKEK